MDYDEKEIWQPIETAPKDRIIRLNMKIFGEHLEVTGWWLPTIDMWTTGGMSMFEADGWMEPTLKDGLRLAYKIVMESYCETVENIEHRNYIAALLDKAAKAAT